MQASFTLQVAAFYPNHTLLCSQQISMRVIPLFGVNANKNVHLNDHVAVEVLREAACAIPNVLACPNQRSFLCEDAQETVAV